MKVKMRSRDPLKTQSQAAYLKKIAVAPAIIPVTLEGDSVKFHETTLNFRRLSWKTPNSWEIPTDRCNEPDTRPQPRQLESNAKQT